jgi:TatD DNase family protein
MHDSHIHLALKPLNENWKRDTQDFLDLGGTKILTQGTDILDFQETFDLAQKINNEFDKNIVDIAIGIHPTIFQERFAKQDNSEICDCSRKILTRFQEIFGKEKENIKAIGETGLDYFEMYNESLDEKRIEIFKEIQKESFRIHVRFAKENNLPLSIHAREQPQSTECVEDALKILAEEGKGLVKGVFHSYTGSIEKLNDILDMGFSVGFNAIITYPSGEDVREILKTTPVENILFETDGPFLPVQSVRRDKKALIRYGRSAQVKEIMKTASEVKNIPEDKLESTTDQNYINMFS